MSEAVPFNKNFDAPPGRVDEILPGVRRIVAPNPSPFTFTGTVTYIVGRGRVAVIDPGPDDARHVAALLEALRGETVTHILVTHTHRDHSPAAPQLKAATGAAVLGEGPHRPSRALRGGETERLDAGGDTAFRPEIVLRDTDVVAGDGWALEAVTTPGHTANHLAFALRGTEMLFSGDHVMGWSTTIVAPPDGAMRPYMESLQKLQGRAEQIYLPGHGPAVHDARRFVRHLIAHRQAREAGILRQLAKNAADIPALVRVMYAGLDPRLSSAAGLSVLAHLEDLAARGIVAVDGDLSIEGTYRLA